MLFLDFLSRDINSVHKRGQSNIAVDLRDLVSLNCFSQRPRFFNQLNSPRQTLRRPHSPRLCSDWLRIFGATDESMNSLKIYHAVTQALRCL